MLILKSVIANYRQTAFISLGNIEHDKPTHLLLVLMPHEIIIWEHFYLKNPVSDEIVNFKGIICSLTKINNEILSIILVKKILYMQRTEIFIIGLLKISF